MSYPYPTPPQQPAPRRGMSTGKKIALFGCLPLTVVALGIAGGCAVIVGSAANEIDKSVKADSAEDKRAAREDVTIRRCDLVTEEYVGRLVKARVHIKNNGNKRANYIVEGEYLDSKGNKVGELLATVNNLAPNTGTEQNFGDAIMPDDLKGVTKGECKIVDVTRDEWSAANN